MPDYLLSQQVTDVNSSLIKSDNYIPNTFVTVANITARNAIGSADKYNGKIVRVLDDGSGNIAYYSWNSGTASWVNAYFPVADGGVSLSSLDADLYAEINTPQLTSLTTVTNQIISLPSTALKGALKVTLSGNTVINALGTLGDCESAVGWSTDNASVATDSSNYLFGSSSLKLTLTSSGGDAYRNIITLIDTSKYYLVTGYVKNGTLLTGLRFRIQPNGVGNANKLSSYATATSWTRIGVLVQPSDFGTNCTSVLMSLETVGNSTGQYAYFDGLMVNEITSAEYALGASALLSKYLWHNDTKSTDKVIVKAVGKNLFDKSKARLGGYYDATGVWNASSGQYSSALIRVDPNTTYCHNRGYVSNWNELDIYGNFLRSTADTKVTTGSNAAYIRVNSYEPQKSINEFQVERGTTSSNFVEYTETSSIVPVELNEVPAIADTFNCNDGKYTKNTQKYTLQASDITQLVTSGTNVDLINTTNFSLAVAFNSGDIDNRSLVVGTNGNKLTETYDTSTTWDLASNVGKYATRVDSGNKIFQFFVAKGTYADLASAKSGLTGTQIIYQLATPVVTYYPTSVLTSEPSGTIYCTPFVSDYDFYDSGCVVTNASYPISSLLYVNIVDKVTGALTSVSLSTCTIASGGLSFTSTAISSEDLVDFGYDHTGLSTVPDVSYQYDDDMKAVVDDTTNDIKNVNQKVDRFIVQERSRIKTVTITLGAISATSSFGALIAPFDCDIIDCKIVTKDNISADNSNYWTVALIDKGSDGSASNTIASRNTTVTTGTAITGYDAWDVGVMDATHSKLTSGDVAILTFTKTGSPTAFAEAYAIISFLPGN